MFFSLLPLSLRYSICIWCRTFSPHLPSKVSNVFAGISGEEDLLVRGQNVGSALLVQRICGEEY